MRPAFCRLACDPHDAPAYAPQLTAQENSQMTARYADYPHACMRRGRIMRTFCYLGPCEALLKLRL